MNKERLYILLRACYLREKLNEFILSVFEKDPAVLSVDLLDMLSSWIDSFDIAEGIDRNENSEERESEADKENIGELIRNQKPKSLRRTPGSVFF